MVHAMLSWLLLELLELLELSALARRVDAGVHATARSAHEIRSLAASQNFLRLRRADVQRLAATKFSPGGAREKRRLVCWICGKWLRLASLVPQLLVWGRSADAAAWHASAMASSSQGLALPMTVTARPSPA